MTRALDGSPFLRAALDLAARGFSVFPCVEGEKVPCISGGFRKATTDIAQIIEWWARFPTANIGLVPGPNYIVLDLDGPKAEETAIALGFADTDTLQVTTARGRHLYFQHPGGTIGNRKIGTHIDVRADNGYVMAPPSVHPSGTIYTWVGDL